MRFEWDPAKARSNLAKHGVAFELARRVWDDVLHVVIPDRVIDREQRWHAIGMVGSVTVLVVVHTYLGPEAEPIVRITVARKATRHERRRYEQETP